MAEIVFHRRRRWEDLGSDLLAMVFSNLGVVDIFIASSVCTSWRAASTNPSLWRTLDFRLWESDASPLIHPHRPHVAFSTFLRHAIARSRGSVISIAFPDFADASDLHFVAQSCPKLRYLYINSASLPKFDFLWAVGMLQFLQGVAIPRYLITIKLMRKFSFSCPAVRELRVLPGDAGVELHIAMLICMFFPLLKKLELNDCRVADAALMCFLDKLKHLEYLDISGHGRVAVTASVLEKASCLKAFFWDCVVHEGEAGNHRDSEDSGDDADIDFSYMDWLGGNGRGYLISCFCYGTSLNAN